jgi:hypothetical protein
MYIGQCEEVLLCKAIAFDHLGIDTLRLNVFCHHFFVLFGVVVRVVGCD